MSDRARTDVKREQRRIGQAVSRASGRSSSTASSRGRGAVPSRSCCRARRCSTSPTACAAGTRRSGRPTSRSRSSPASCSSGAGCRSTPSASTCRATSSRRSSCAPSRRRRRASSGSSSARRPPAPGLVAAAAEALGIDEVWALGGPQAIGWLAYVRKVDKIVGPGNAYVNEAKLEVQRDVAIDLPGGPSEVVVVAAGDVDRRIVELELAAQAEHGPDTRLPRRRDARGGRGDRARAPRAARRRRGAAPARCGTPAPSSSARSRRSRPATTRPAATTSCRRAAGPARSAGSGSRRSSSRSRRSGSPPKASRGSARRSRRSPRPRACPRTPRRCGDEAARARVPRLHLGAAERRGRPARRHRPLAGRPLRPEHPAAAAALDTRPGTIAGALASISSYPPGGYHELRGAIADYNGVEPENVVLGAGADDLILLCARCFAGPGRHDRDPGGADLPALPDRRAARAAPRSATTTPSLTFTCRPNSPDGELRPLPDARPLVCDEAYFEYCGETAVPLLDDGVIVLRTFSKAFGARRRADRLRARRAATIAAELNARQAPAPVSTLSAALAVAALASPPDVRPVIEERERLASALRAIGLAAARLERELPLRPGRGRPRARRRAAPPGARRARLRRRHPDHDPRPGRRRPARRGARAAARPAGAGRGRRRPPRAPPARDGRDADRRPARPRRREPRQRPDGRRHLRPLPRAARLPRRARSRRRGRRATSRPATTTPSRTRRSRSARRSTRRSATAAGSPATATRSCRWTTRSPAPRSISAAGRSPSSRSSPSPGMAGALLRQPRAGRRGWRSTSRPSGRDAHHTAEAAYKAVGRALKTALRVESTGIPSTKGKL